MKRTKELERTAHHEAGHAVAAVELGIGLKGVSIVPGADGSLGQCFTKGPSKRLEEDLDAGAWEDKTRSWLEKHILVFLAGPAAEKRFDKRARGVWQCADVQNAGEMAMSIVGSERELQAYMDWLTIRAENLVSLPWHWASIESLATVLLGDMAIRPQRARGIIRDAQRETGS